MKLAVAYRRRRLKAALARGSRLLTTCAVSAALAVPVVPARAQTPVSTDGGTLHAPQAVPGQRLLLEADQLIYDFDRKTVTAVGNVQIYYDGYALDAERVTYDQNSGRLIATGGIRMLDPDGNLITTEQLDITDDFREGFIGSLNLITTDGARFTAQTAERRDGNLMIFRRGVYTACEPCLEHPERPPLWQIKAARIIHDSKEHMIYYENARLEFFGLPIAYMPVFFHPDPTVHRKTGFLVPSMLQGDTIGVGVTTPFFWNIAPNYDVTFSPTMLSRQGLLMQTEWRHRLMHGSYAIRLAGIFQHDPGAFKNDGLPLSGDRDFRGSVGTDGAFRINSDWVFGWDLNYSSDRTFNRDYQIPGSQDKELQSTVYLTGLGKRNYFNVAGHYFRIQREDTVEVASRRRRSDDRRCLRARRPGRAGLRPSCARLQLRHGRACPRWRAALRFEPRKRDARGKRPSPSAGALRPLLRRRRRHVHARDEPRELEASLHPSRRPARHAVQLRAGGR